MIAWPILAGMATIRNRRLNPQPRRALELLLASSPHGATEALLVRAHGFNSDMIASLIITILRLTQRRCQIAHNFSIGHVETDDNAGATESK